MSDVMSRVAGAPISWGVCEVPGWGYQLAPQRVLTEMAATGLAATEFGPDGFLPDDPAARAALLASHHLSAVGGFVPVVLHEAGYDPVPEVRAALRGFVAAGARTLVLAADSGATGYDARGHLDDEGWAVLLANLLRVADAAAEVGVVATLHPHVGTLVEGPDDVTRVLEDSDAPLCLDTGHLLVGGTDPEDVVSAAAGRVAHTHLKDVDAALAARVRAGEVTYTDAVRTGLYRPLGHGDVDVAGIVRRLEACGYTGWYVMEQDCVLTGPPDGEGPVADVRESVAFLARVAGAAA